MRPGYAVTGWLRLPVRLACRRHRGCRFEAAIGKPDARSKGRLLGAWRRHVLSGKCPLREPAVIMV
jgi:hypothetical protein